MRILDVLDHIWTLALIVLYLTDIAQSHLDLNKLIRLLLFHRPFEINNLFCFHMLSIGNHSNLILHKNIRESFLPLCQGKLVRVSSTQVSLNLVSVHVDHVVVFLLNRVNAPSCRVNVLKVSEACVTQLLLLLLLL